ncbi:MAG TPA: HAD family hydrolase [Bryobacteraceae bacterium]|nr:HAD family hydrolase [Bryobacteraceae bacterium]
MEGVYLVCPKGSGRRLPDRSIPPFKVYIFDVDGTLLDSAQDICAAVQHVLSAHVSEPLPFDYLKSFVGFHLDEVFLDVVPNATRDQLDRLIELYKADYLGRKHASTRPFAGVVEALASLGGRKTTATTKGTPTTRAVLEQFGLISYFDHVQGTDGFPCKPAPDVLMRAIAALEASPEDCLFIGDSEADMEAGRRAGVRICAVDYGYGKAEGLAKWEPDFRISDLRELNGN